MLYHKLEFSYLVEEKYIIFKKMISVEVNSQNMQK